LEVLPSAQKHGVDPLDALHVARNYLATETLGEEPRRYMRVGFDRSGRLLEVVVLTSDEGLEFVIHAMKARPAYLGLLDS